MTKPLSSQGSGDTSEVNVNQSPHSFDAALVTAFVADRLGKAQRRVILSLTDSWGAASCHKTARRMFYGVTTHRYTVIHHKHRTDNCWRLSSLGIAVKELLLARGGDA